jgi:hypothetical protein
MTGPIFNQKSRIGQVLFEVRDGKLLLSSRILRGPFTEHSISLGRLSPDYKPQTTRNYALVVVPLIFAFICGAAIWKLIHQTTLSEDITPGLYFYPVLGLVASLFGAVRGSRRIEYYQFYTTTGQPAFSIVREREQAQECAAFITALVAQIEFARSGVAPDTSMVRLIRADQDAARMGDSSPRRDFWQISIACGLFAAGLPWLPNAHYYFSGFLFPLVFWLCVGGAAFCVFSFLRNESNRWWSVLGLVFALIPPFFY